MISYEEVKRLIRFKEKDNNEIRFSDYEIKMVVNECIRYLNNSYALQNSDFLERAVTFVEADMNEELGSAGKPDVPTQPSAPQYDYLGQGVLGEYIIGKKGNDVSGYVFAANANPEVAGEVEYYDFKVKGLSLPEDLITLVSVQRLRDGYVLHPTEAIKTANESEYKVVGGRLYSGTNAFVLLYKAAIAEVGKDDDVIMLPFVFKDVIVKLSCMILNNAETDVMMKAVDDAVRAIVPRRRYTNARIKMPFMI